MDFFNELSGELVAVIVNFIIGILALLVLPKLYSYLKISADDKRRVLIETAIVNGIKWAAMKLNYNYKELVDPTKPVPASVVAKAKEYVETTAPGALKALQVDNDALNEAITARVPKAAAELSATVKTVQS